MARISSACLCGSATFGFLTRAGRVVGAVVGGGLASSQYAEDAQHAQSVIAIKIFGIPPVCRTSLRSTTAHSREHGGKTTRPFFTPT